MAKRKTSPLIRCVITCMLLVTASMSGCASLQFFNSNFLDTFEPFGMTSESQQESEGPLFVVVENLTKAACNGEFADVTITYEGTPGGEIRIGYVPAVPEQDRLTDTSFRQIVILNCKDVTSVTMTATIYRVQITEETTEEVFVRDSTRTIYLADENQGSASASFDFGQFMPQETVDDGDGGTVIITDGGTQVDVCTVDITQTEVVEAVTLVGEADAGTEQPTLECGSAIVFGILDEIEPDGDIKLKDYDCDYLFTRLSTQDLVCATGAELAFITGFLADDAEAIAVIQKWASQGTSALSDTELAILQSLLSRDDLLEGYFNDPDQLLLSLLYPYPEKYLVISLTLPQLSGLDSVAEVLADQAALMSNQLP